MFHDKDIFKYLLNLTTHISKYKVVVFYHHDSILKK